MNLRSFWHRHKPQKHPKSQPEVNDETAVKGSEAYFDAGLTDQESAGFRQKSSLIKKLLQGKNQDPYKDVR